MILCLQGTFVVTKDANLIFKYHPITMNDFKDMHVTRYTLFKGRLCTACFISKKNTENN